MDVSLRVSQWLTPLHEFMMHFVTHMMYTFFMMHFISRMPWTAKYVLRCRNIWKFVAYLTNLQNPCLLMFSNQQPPQ